MWKGTRKREGSSVVQAEGGGRRAGGRSEAADTDEWDQTEKLCHKDSAKQ